MKINHRSFFIWLVILTLTALTTWGMDSEDLPSQDNLMKFKLGLEFQESSGLYPWEINDNVQKKPLFFFHHEKVCLWHVVIDTNDIEFVTRSFLPHEKDSLRLCISSILTAVESLKAILLQSSTTTFHVWKDDISLMHKSAEFRIEDNPKIDFEAVKEIIRPNDQWEPQFSPQVTIQHHLSITIPLYFSLFGFESSDMLKFSASFPNRELFLAHYKKIELCGNALTACKDCYEEFKTDEAERAYKASEENAKKLIPKLQSQLFRMYQKVCSPLDGFVFLHALTLVNMTPIDDIGDRQFLIEIMRNQQKYKQIDPKIRLNLMSRRPFSSMMKDLRLEGVTYADYFKAAMQDRNFKFSKIFDVPGLFHKTNYAEQFFDQSGQVINLGDFSQFFQDDFFSNNKGVISSLLHQGILGTAMLRNFKPHILTTNGLPIHSLFEDYYRLSIQTVTTPTKRYVIDPINSGIIQVEMGEYDVLSPPWILHSSNSMGRFKEEEMEKQDMTYGEAIIEVRSIRSVQPWFLKMAGVNTASVGNFLTSPNEHLVDQALGLFDYLGHFEYNLLTRNDYGGEILLKTMTAIKRY